MNTPFEKRICFTVCICQMTAVLSCVSVIYLTVAIYKPAYISLTSGFLEEPVMCTTIANTTPSNCDLPHGPNGDLEKWKAWNSCSEWCLSKSSGNCPRIMVDVTRNGTAIQLEGCESISTKVCLGINPNQKPRICALRECRTMSGLYNCTTPVLHPGIGSPNDQIFGAKCIDLTSILKCNFTNNIDEVSNCEPKIGCLSLNGTYQCRRGQCERLKEYNCERYCDGIATGSKTIIVREGDTIFSAQCQRAINRSSGEEIWPLNYKSDVDPNIPKTLLIFCTNMFSSPRDNTTFTMTDCFNGTLLEPNHFGDTTDILQLIKTHTMFMDEGYERDGLGLIGPSELDLRIFGYNNTRLTINYESCVNTLILNECEKFYAEYGGDGSDLRTQSRYKCFYSPYDSDFVTVRFSRARILTELMLATTIPIGLAVVSCMTLIICSRIIHVGDDSHFYFQCCGDDAKKILQQDHVEAMAL